MHGGVVTSTRLRLQLIATVCCGTTTEHIAVVVYNSVAMTQYILSNPNILDGEPVIAGTRIPVVELLLLLSVYP